ncbi:MAG: asparagine synthetase B family protein, partial [Burkholderiales bacterium]
GWTGGAVEPGAERSTLDTMVRALVCDANAQSQRVSDTHANVAVCSGHGDAWVAAEGGIIAALAGRPVWGSKALEAFSLQNGAAAAAAKAYLQEGVEMLQGIHGTFSLAILDQSKQLALLAIDRLGIHTLCYAQRDDAFVFGSTADAIVAHPTVNRETDPQAIFNYLYFHMVPSPGTIYRGVQKLLPAEYALWHQGKLQNGFYWGLGYQDDGNRSVSDLSDKLRRLLRESVKSAAGDGTGTFLSGGTDSSTVTGILTDISGAPVNTYSIGFDAPGYDEMDYAHIAARHFGACPHEYYVTPQDVADAIPWIADAYDEPFGNASAVPTYYCARAAQQDGIRVLLAGDGGDEIFGGNARYAKQKVFEYYRYIPQALRAGLIEPLAFGIPLGQHIPILRKARSYAEQASVPLPDRLESYNFLQRTPLQEILDSRFLASIDPLQPLMLMREVYERTRSDSAVNRMMHLDLKQTLADNDLRKVGRMCALAGIEVRYPLLDERLVDFSGELPPELKVKGQQLRYLFKEALRNILPPETIAKSKHGFGLPFGLWLKSHETLRQLAHDSLQSFGHRGYLKKGYIENLVVQHREQDANYYGVMIWVIMMLEQWLQAHRL